MPMIDTGFLDVLCNETGSDTPTALTDALAVYDLMDIVMDVFIRAATPKAKVRLGIIYSDNPFDFSGSTPTAFSATYLDGTTDKGWNHGAYSGEVGATGSPKLFCRIVALGALNQNGVSGEGLSIRVIIRPAPFVKRTVASPRRRVNTKGSDTNAATVPLTDPFETQGLVSHRLWKEVTSAGPSLIDVTFGYQETDTPDDPTSWGSVTTLGSAHTGNGVTMPTTFAAVTFTKRFARYVASVKNQSGGTGIESAHCMVRAELRGC